MKRNEAQKIREIATAMPTCYRLTFMCC